MMKNEQKTLYRDAVYEHFINQGYSEYKAQKESSRLMSEKI
ncbi:MAG: hypothetical protein NT038_08915 [Euryarchaeota archaeon]|nr:hypothetical protein [Euryarchaeota archaeon]